MLVIKLLLAILILKVLVFIILLIRRGNWLNRQRSSVSPLKVDIIVPMYNEEKVIIKTIQNLLKLDYDMFKIIIIDDGSTDKSLKLVNEHFANNPLVVILSQVNSGKSIALNKAITLSKSDIIICVDADTLLMPDTIRKFIPYFSDKNVAAASGYIKVGNRCNLITSFQYIEYITNQNFERMVFEFLNGIIVVPGAIGAFRRSVILELGGFASKTLTEDSDLSIRILNSNYRIRNASDVIAFTEAPSSIQMFNRQRARWKVGSVEVLIKYNKDLLFHENKALSYLVIPYTWIYTIILPLFTHLIDYILLYNIIFNNDIYRIVRYYIIFIALDALLCQLILLKNNETFSLLFTLLQRFALRHLIFFVHLYILLRYIKGDLFSWSKIKRDGNATINNTNTIYK